MKKILKRRVRRVSRSMHWSDVTVKHSVVAVR
jgi:hypothetical protein